MKFAAALTSVAVAVNLETKDGDHGFIGKPSFSIGQHYREPDYSQPYGEELPGADFNKQVYQFNENRQIWDQNDYEERTKQEAEILVALEALKTSSSYLSHDLYALHDKIIDNRGRIGANQADVWENAEALKNMVVSTAKKVNQV